MKRVNVPKLINNLRTVLKMITDLRIAIEHFKNIKMK